eukprot:COSAG01_NODE_5304_length_4350_cov_8.058104_4_plen_60_part_00
MLLASFAVVARTLNGGAFKEFNSMSGPAMLLPEDPLADTAARDLLWTTSVDVTGAHFSF